MIQREIARPDREPLQGATSTRMRPTACPCRPRHSRRPQALTEPDFALRVQDRGAMAAGKSQYCSRSAPSNGRSSDSWNSDRPRVRCPLLTHARVRQHQPTMLRPVAAANQDLQCAHALVKGLGGIQKSRSGCTISVGKRYRLQRCHNVSCRCQGRRTSQHYGSPRLEHCV